MGTMGLALPWEHRIPPVPRDRERRLEPFRDPPSLTGLDAAAEAAKAEDSALAAACQAGDLRAYEQLFAQQGTRMKNLARNLLGNPLDAEDAVQETFLKIQRSIGSFRGQSSFVTWTFRILVNTCRMMRAANAPEQRKWRTRILATGDAPPIEPRAPGSHPSLWLALERALAELTQHQRGTCSCSTKSKALSIPQDRGDAGDYRSSFEEHAVPGKEKFASDAGAAAQQRRDSRRVTLST